MPPKREKKNGISIATLVLGIISAFGLCCCGLNIITAPIAIILGIIAIVKKADSIGLAVTGLFFAVLSLVVIGATFYSVREILPYSDVIMTDYMHLIEDQDTVFPAYKEDKTLPDYMEKYKESPFSEFLAKYDMDIYQVMDVLLESYENGQLKTPYEFTAPSSSSSAASTMPADEPVI